MRIMSRRETPLSLSRFLVDGFLGGIVARLFTVFARNTDSIRREPNRSQGRSKHRAREGHPSILPTAAPLNGK
jgi:hypothetical protein